MTLKCDHIKRMITLTSDNIKRFLLHYLSWLLSHTLNQNEILNLLMLNGNAFNLWVPNFIHWYQCFFTDILPAWFVIGQRYLSGNRIWKWKFLLLACHPLNMIAAPVMAIRNPRDENILAIVAASLIIYFL